MWKDRKAGRGLKGSMELQPAKSRRASAGASRSRAEPSAGLPDDGSEAWPQAHLAHRADPAYQSLRMILISLRSDGENLKKSCQILVKSSQTFASNIDFSTFSIIYKMLQDSVKILQNFAKFWNFLKIFEIFWRILKIFEEFCKFL